MKRLIGITGLVVLVAAIVAALSVAAPTAKTGPEAKLPPKPRLPALPAEVRSRGKWQIGVKCDTPPFGWQDTSGRNRGYDVEVARQFARWAFGSASRVDFTCTTTASRIGTLTSSRVDIIISTLTWTAAARAADRLLGPLLRRRRATARSRTTPQSGPWRRGCAGRRSPRRPARSTTAGSRTASRTRRSRSSRARARACSR